MALGATPVVITKLVLGRAAVWTLAGAFMGLAGSLFATRALQTMLFEVPARDCFNHPFAKWAYDELRPMVADKEWIEV
jgi:hypothetical protein